MTETIAFGGGCFWCTEAVFQQLKGVESVTSGYAGGHVEDPSYEQVTTGKTGHAEVIKIEFDPTIISIDTLLTVFFASHDPTTPNQQGADIGPQYRSIILYTTEQQQQKALTKIEDLGEGIVTEVVPLDNFYEAEDYHQNFMNNNPNQPYVQAVVNPKVEKVRKEFKDLLNSGELF